MASLQELGEPLPPGVDSATTATRAGLVEEDGDVPGTPSAFSDIGTAARSRAVRGRGPCGGATLAVALVSAAVLLAAL